jgi:hypothetical protein
VKRRPIWAFALLCFVCIVVAVTYTVVSDRRAARATAARGPALTATQGQLDALAARPHVLFRSTEVNGDFGRLAIASLDDVSHPLYTSLSCERVAFGGGRGLCLSADRGAITTYKVSLFDEHFHVVKSISLPGLPSRARVSNDGRYGATTTFVYGDSYAGTSYSTRTELYDMRTGKTLGNLEQFTTIKDGHVVDAIDRNLWGVTFDPSDSNRFYATESTGGQYYLVQGDLTARRMVVLRSGVECPSLSPDGKQIAFKSRHIGALGRVEWQLSVLDLSTLRDHPVAETRSVDDQAEWLDDDTVLYALPRASSGTPADDTWAVPADGRGSPRRYLAGAYSTVVVDASR